jgi:hypothetical protein
MMAQLVREIDGDKLLLEVILFEVEGMRCMTEIHPYLEEIRELRTLVLSSHGKQGMKRWKALYDNLMRGNRYTRSVISSEDRQIKRLLANWREENE